MPLVEQAGLQSTSPVGSVWRRRCPPRAGLSSNPERAACRVGSILVELLWRSRLRLGLGCVWRWSVQVERLMGGSIPGRAGRQSVLVEPCMEWEGKPGIVGRIY